MGYSTKHWLFHVDWDLILVLTKMSSTTWFPPRDQPLCVDINGTVTLIDSSNVPNQGTSSYLDTDSDYRITYRVFNNKTIATLAPVTGGGGGQGSVLSPGLLAEHGVHLNGSRVVRCPDGSPEMTEDMKFTDEKFMMVIVYCCIFIVAAVGNLTVFITLFRNRSELFSTNISHKQPSVPTLMSNATTDLVGLADLTDFKLDANSSLLCRQCICLTSLTRAKLNDKMAFPA